MNNLNFEEIIKCTREYQTLVFQHGERLFIKRDGEYEVLSIRLAYRIHCMATMTESCVHEWYEAVELSGRFGGRLVRKGYRRCRLCDETEPC